MKCYLCNNSVSKFLYKNNYQLFRCNTCGLIFYDFEKNYAEFLGRQYSKGYFTGDSKLKSYIDYGKDKKNIYRNMKWYVQEIKKYKKDGRYLDVGCAYGYAMEIAQEKGFKVYGIDPSEYAISQARKMFPKNAWTTYLSDIKFDDRYFDVISLFDVFEHLQNPKKDLQKIKKVLKDDGLLVIATGDTDCFWAKFSGRRWTFYNPPQHIFYFNRKNITRILQESGFEIVKIATAGKWLSIPYIFHLAETVGESSIAKFIGSVLIHTPLSKIPIYLKLHDNMVIFARKNQSKQYDKTA
jgi:2-polyprenyl-3-methyl-5-hydroxy-6-metoxy-1,4-benzoquinol methylase